MLPTSNCSRPYAANDLPCTLTWFIRLKDATEHKTLKNTIQDLPAIDAHAHYGICDRGPSARLSNFFMSADAATVVARARAANVQWTVVSPLLGLISGSKTNAEAGNDEAVRVVEQTPGLLQWVLLNPLQPRTFDQTRERLVCPKCMGIKIHPEEHGYKIAEQGKALFEFAARFDNLSGKKEIIGGLPPRPTTIY